MSARFSIGIDLGTTNSALAIEDFETGHSGIVEITQIIAPGQLSRRPTLPSALYVTHPQEFDRDAISVPWGGGDYIIGAFARSHGALVPDRLVTSAKSGLSNTHVDPRKPVLPWRSGIEEPKVSAFGCSVQYLRHLKEAFLEREKAAGNNRDLSQAEVVITVPASFDEVARALTSEAAHAAGFPRVVLLEEPQAAFYAWTAHTGADWRKQAVPGDIILVCDIGGGTADFSLIAVSEQAGNLTLERISVGEHLLLGGDNMDLALAYHLRAQMEAEGKSLDEWQFLSLINGAGQAKVQLFGNPELTETAISVPSRGSSLFARTLSVTLTRTLLEQVVLEGFFPITTIDDLPVETSKGALHEFGLPYAADPVISKHLARFLRRSLKNVQSSESLRALVGGNPDGGKYLRPTAILFNGGVFHAAPIRKRILELLANWTGGAGVRELQGDQPDLAVAKGAALYGRTRATGEGFRIRAGTARSYYIGLESSMPAIPGFKPPIKALCVVPQGMEEGTELLIDGKEFGLLTGQQAEFRFFSSEMRGGDAPGDILPNAEKELVETARLEVALPSAEGFPANQPVPVIMNPVVTPLGNLELWMKHTGSDRRWKVEFQVRME
jgi:hypothetical protein